MFIRHPAATALAGGLAVIVIAAAAGAQERQGGPPPSSDQQPAGQRDGRRGPGKWWVLYRSELQLSPDQGTRIEAIFRATFPQLRASYETLSKREEQLSALIVADDATEAEVLRQADQIEAIRSELSKTRVLMLFRMRRVLTPEQRDKLQMLQKDHESRLAAPPPKRDRP